MNPKINIVLLVILLTQIAYAVPTSFIDIRVDESLDKFYVRAITFGPESQHDTCGTKDNQRFNCSLFLYYKSPVWADIENTDVFLNTQRFYVLTHPDTKAEYIKDCSKLAGAFEVNTPITISREKDKLRLQPGKPDELTLSFSLYDNYTYPCTYIQYPYLNPYLIKKYQKFYPYDYYILDLAFYIPKVSLVNFEVNLPKDFKLSIINTTPPTKTLTKSNSNTIFFEFKDLDKINNNPFGATIKFERYPTFNYRIFPFFMLILLPLATILYFAFSPNINSDGRRMIATNAFYLSLLPLFVAFGGYFQQIPSIYSIAHASFVFSIFLLVCSLIKDFTKYEFKRGWYRFGFIVLSIIISITPLFF